METSQPNYSNIEKGIIKRVYMENFVTYDKAVFTPGKNLNLIIGPNGTGKSTIVCAIVLGLGGKPKLIGRAEKVADYVKAGCEEAKIEIELLDTGKKTIVIARKITSYNTTMWYINGKHVSIKDVTLITKQLNIQIDNLCQFLPQDKVQSFSEMDSQKLLMETERSVGDPLLLEYHEKLIEYRKVHKNLETEVASKSRSLENKIQKYDGLKDIVGNIKEKKTIKKKIVTLNQKKQWMLYDQMRQLFKDSKKQRDAAASRMKELDEQLKPIKAMIANLQSNINVIQNSVRDKGNQLSAKMGKVRKAIEEIQAHEDNVREIENTRDRKIEQEQVCDQTISSHQQQKSKLDNDLRSILEEFGSEEAVAEQQNKALELVDNQRRIIDTFNKDMNTWKYKDDQLNRGIRNLERELQMARGVESQRLELLRTKNPDAYKGVLWLRENMNMFSATVHEPMFLNINVKNPKFSKYFENTLSYNDMIAFVCENSQDMNLLVKCLRGQQKLVVNVVLSDPGRNVRMHPNIPLEEIKQFGFEHYLISLVEAPSTIMKYIVQNFHLANIPVGSEAVEENVDRIPDSLGYYFSKSNVFSVSRSKYTGDKAVRQNAVTGNGMLSITLDTTKLNGIHDRINQLKVEKEEISREIQECESQINEANKKMSDYRAIRMNYQQKIVQIQTLRSKIRMAVENITKLQEDRTSVEEIESMYKSEIQNVIISQMTAYKNLNTLLEECFAFEQASGETKLELKLKQQSLRQCKTDSQELRDKCDDAERTFKNLEDELRPLKHEVENLYKQALESTNGISPQDKNFKTFNTAFEKLPNTIEAIEEEHRTAQAKVFCMGKNDDSENILKEFEKVQKEVEDLKQLVSKKTEELQTLTAETENVRNKWLPLLEGLVDRINVNFSRYFSEMKCAGEISLTHDENVMDFDKYGLKIRVKFRDVDKLQELTRTHQSGGERAVTTAVYMISLQELSRVPFRCVDEINQGMDAVNERRIFELIVNITGSSNSSQYFLLTPKLLPNLTYSKTVTVHCVYNGQFMVSHEDFSVDEFCRSLH